MWRRWRSNRRCGPWPVHPVQASAPAPDQIAQAAQVLEAAKTPIILAGHGAARHQAQEALIQFSEKLKIPVATTFHGKGVFPDDHPNALGTMGFMVHDYVNFGFDQADVIVSVGYELQEFAPARINPQGDKQIIHLHRFPAMVDAYYDVTVEVQGDIPAALDGAGRQGLPQARLGRRRAANPLPAAGGTGARPAGRVLSGEAPASGGGYPRRPGTGGHRPGGQRRGQDVDGPPLSHLSAQHLPGLERAVHHGVCPARGAWGSSWPIPAARCWRSWETAAF